MLRTVAVQWHDCFDFFEVLENLILIKPNIVNLVFIRYALIKLFNLVSHNQTDNIRY